MLLLPGDNYATRHQGPVLQQLEHPIAPAMSRVNDCFRPVARFFDRISRPEQLLTALPEAMRVLTSPVETGAVVIALPQDVQSHAYAFPERFFEPRVWRIERPPPDSHAVQAAIELLEAAERPLLVAGGGVRYSEAGAALAEFAEHRRCRWWRRPPARARSSERRVVRARRRRARGQPGRERDRRATPTS